MKASGMEHALQAPPSYPEHSGRGTNNQRIRPRMGPAFFGERLMVLLVAACSFPWIYLVK